MLRGKKKARAADVAEQLRNDILAGRLSPGQRLTEMELCERFMVGRGRIREAIQQLAQQGLLVIRANRGATVAPDAPKEIQELVISIRRMVETFALEKVYDDLQEADFNRWEKILADLRDGCTRGDHAAIAEADLAFHRFLLERAGFADLLLIWDTIVGRIRTRFLQAQWRLTRLLDLYDEHRRILDVFKAGDRAAAVRMLTRWIE